MPRKSYTPPPATGSSTPDFCYIFGVLYSIWAKEHGFGDVKITFEPVPPGEKPREGAYVIRHPRPEELEKKNTDKRK